MDHGSLRTSHLKFKHVLRSLSWALSLAAIIYFARIVVRTGLTTSGLTVGQLVGVVVLGAAIYGLGVAFLAMLWSSLVVLEPASKNHRSGVVSIYLISQFGKYLPGNVFQYVGRHMLGRQLGFGHSQLAAAAVMEALLMAVGSAALVLSLGRHVLHTLIPSIPLIPAIVGAVPLLILPVVTWLPGRFRALSWIPAYRLSKLASLMVGYAAFFAIFGTLYWALLLWLSPSPAQPIHSVIGASSTAWLVGFLVPGAPAGAGLREAALALAAGGHHPGPSTLTAILLFRLITLGGDLLAFLAGHILKAMHAPAT